MWWSAKCTMSLVASFCLWRSTVFLLLFSSSSKEDFSKANIAIDWIAKLKRCMNLLHWHGIEILRQGNVSILTVLLSSSSFAIFLLKHSFLERMGHNRSRQRIVRSLLFTSLLSTTHQENYMLYYCKRSRKIRNAIYSRSDANRWCCMLLNNSVEITDV